MKLLRTYVAYVGLGAALAAALLAAPAAAFPPVDELPAWEGPPSPFERIDGTRVDSPQDWPAHREYLMDMLAHYMYGEMPPKPETVTWEVVDMRPALDGEAIVENMLITVHHNDSSVSVRAAALRPARPGRFPVIIKNDVFLFDHDQLDEEEIGAIRPGRIDQQTFADKQAVERGYVRVKFMREDVAVDEANRRDTGVFPLYPEYEAWGIVTAWAWAYQFIIDVMKEQDYADVERVVATGHSRGGKAALCAGIYEERIAVTAPNSSGAGGTASWRFFDEDQARQTLQVHQERSDHQAWWSPRLMEFVGNEERMPFDAHTNRAAIAPRALLNTHARHDWWANPYGTALAHLAAQPVFEWLGVADRQALHWRDGGHDQGEKDWQALYDFCDRYFFGASTNLVFEVNPHPDQYEFDSETFTYRAPAPQ